MGTLQQYADEVDEMCIFCLIASGRDENTEVIAENDELVCFRDIDPAAPHHYLVIPKKHIYSCFSLQHQDIGLVEKMADMGRATLHGRGITNMKDIRLGFHPPPYISVDHLHLHVLAPASQITDNLSYKFRPGSHRFITEEDMCNSLHRVKPSEGLANNAFELDECSKPKTFESETGAGSVAHLVSAVVTELGCQLRKLMATQNIPQTTKIEDCHFCIIANKPTDIEILLSDDELVCFRDSKPGAMHHYLVVPKSHLVNCKALQRDHIPLVEQMQEMGRRILEKNRVQDLKDIRMGFHLPPFSSVPHLHLHVLAPASQMSSRSLSRYGPQSFWFITVDKVLHQLRTHSKVK